MRWGTTGGHINLFRKRAQPWHTIGDRTEWQAIADEIKPAQRGKMKGRADARLNHA